MLSNEDSFVFSSLPTAMCILLTTSLSHSFHRTEDPGDTSRLHTHTHTQSHSHTHSHDGRQSEEPAVAQPGRSGVRPPGPSTSPFLCTCGFVPSGGGHGVRVRDATGTDPGDATDAGKAPDPGLAPDLGLAHTSGLQPGPAERPGRVH